MLTIKNLNKEYDNQVLKNIELNINQNGIYSIIGESGSGKTTLLHIIVGIDTNYEGDILFDNKNIKEMSSKEIVENISIVYQDYKLHENLTVRENLRIIPFKNVNDDSIEAVLKQLDISGVVNKKVVDLSGGQKQRVAIARCLLIDSPIICFDEPTASLDETNYNNVMEILKEISKQKIILIITHDKRVMEDANLIYQLKNMELTLLTVNNEIIGNAECEPNRQFEEKKIKGLFFKRNNKSSINTFILYYFFVLLIVIALSLVNSYFQSTIDMWISNIDSTSIHISTHSTKDAKIDSLHYFWNNEDIEKISSIENVEDVVAFEESSTLFIDQDGYTLSFDYEIGDDVTNLTFETVKLPKEIYKNYGYYSPNVIAGEYPDDDSNQLLIPDIVAYTIDDNFENVVNKSITLPVENIETNEQTEKEYTISGVYKTENTTQIESSYYIYIGNVLDIYDSGLYSPDKAGYAEYSDEMTYEEYIRSVGVGLPDLLIKVSNTKQVSEVESQLSEMYPNLIIESQNYYKSGVFTSLISKINAIRIIAYIVIVVIFMILNYFLFQEYFKNRMKEYFINVSLGYSRKTLIKNILYELLIKNIILLFIIFLCTYLLAINIKIQIIAASLLSINNALLILGFIIIINLLNVYVFFMKTKNITTLYNTIK